MLGSALLALLCARWHCWKDCWRYLWSQTCMSAWSKQLCVKRGSNLCLDYCNAGCMWGQCLSVSHLKSLLSSFAGSLWLGFSFHCGFSRTCCKALLSKCFVLVIKQRDGSYSSKQNELKQITCRLSLQPNCHWKSNFWSNPTTFDEKDLFNLHHERLLHMS